MKKEFKNIESARTSKGRARVQAKRQTDEMKKSATGREKYVKINWKSIECDVKIKFIRAATSAEIAMGIYLFRGLAGTHCARRWTCIFFWCCRDRVNNFWRVDGECIFSCVKISSDTSFSRCRLFVTRRENKNSVHDSVWSGISG